MALFKKNKPAFSLIEVLISFTILSISLIAITQLITTTIQANRQNTSRLQAYYLAEQGIELTRHVRDSNWLQNIGFDSAGAQNNLWQSNNGTTANITPQTKELIIDLQTNTLGATQKNVSLSESQNGNNQIYLNTDPQTNIKFFTHQRNTTSIPTEFKRTIHITNNFQDFHKLEQYLNLDDYDLSKNLILVESNVQYGNNYQKEIKLQTLLTDWKEGPF